MRKYRWLTSIVWLFAALLALTVLVSVPVVERLFKGVMEQLYAHPSTVGLARFLDITGVPYLRLLLVLAIALVLINRFVGLQWGIVREFKACWKLVPTFLKQMFWVVMILILIVNIDAAVEWIASSISESGGEKYHEVVSRHIRSGPLAVSLFLLNAVAIILFTSLVLLGNSKRPAWERDLQSDARKTLRDTSAQRLALSPKQQKWLRKAEKALEKNRVRKAARIFERIGELYAYRAGKLYERMNEADLAARAYLTAGAYFCSQGSFKKAGDAYYFAADFETAIRRYQQVLAENTQLSGNQMEELVRNLGDAYTHMNQFREAAELYRNYGFYRKAAEAFERAGMPKEAGEQYAQAGDPEASAKVFEQSGRLDLAGLERGRAFMVRGDFIKAAEEFFRIDRFADSANAFERAGETHRAAIAHQRAGNWEKAAELFLESGATEEALTCYLNVEEYDKAAQLAAHLGLQDKQAIYYEKAENFLAAARSFLMIQNTDAAVRCFRQLSLESADQVYSCAQVIQILMKQGRVKEALSCCEAMLVKTRPTPTTAQIYFLFAAIKEKLGYAAHAADLYIQAASLLPSNRAYVKKAKEVATAAGLPFENMMADTIVHSREKGEEIVKQAAEESDAKEPTPSTHEADATHTIDELDESMVFDLAEEGSFSRYEIIQELGRGGMGIVYKARDRRLDRMVAFKMLHPEFNKDPKVLLFFKREARAIAQLNHPNIVTLYDVGSEKGCFFMVMEYVEGMTLEKLRTKYPKYVIQNFLGLLYETATGLKVAHDKGVLHRDLKPSNLMVTKDGRVKIMDFGLAKNISDTNKTQQVWGTPMFMAPEVMQGDKATFASDIYSVGVTFYLLLTGQAPFDRDSMANKFVGNGLPKAPHEINPEVVFEVSESILKCMQRDPVERYQNAGELLTVVKLLGQQVKK
ncbi:MAG: protein kinase [Acidobacteria bacterium]|nr:protein kinase [Acidobacteriota bacterium]